LPRWARISIALACVGIGIASSTVAGWLLVRGLELTEPDDKARLILTAAGVLMIVTELTAFFLTALLPTARLYQLRVMGIALLVFEVVTIFGTRLVLSDGAESAAIAHTTRIENAQRSIEARQADADRVRAVGERQAASDHAWTRHLGTLAIKQADAMEREIEPLREQLAELQAQRRPTFQHALGPQLALAHSIATPVLISSTGLVLFGVAGLMLRRNRDEVRLVQPAVQDQPDPVQPVQAAPVQSISPVQTVPEYRTAVPMGAVPAVPQPVSTLHHWRSIAAVAPLAAMSMASVAVAAPAAQAPAETATTPEIEPATPVAVQPEAEAGMVIHQQECSPPPEPVRSEAAPVQSAVQVSDDAGTDSQEVGTVEPEAGTGSDDCYQRLRAAVLAGEVKPSVRALREARYGGTDAVRRYLQQLAAEGLITKTTKGYALVPPLFRLE
jgi:hypothetical protein